jgi:hypothetical protein
LPFIDSAAMEAHLSKEGFAVMRLEHSSDEPWNIVQHPAINLRLAHAEQPVWVMPGGMLAPSPEKQVPAGDRLDVEALGRPLPEENVLQQWREDAAQGRQSASMVYDKHVGFPKGELYHAGPKSLRHPLNLDAYAHAPQSLMRLVPALLAMEGFADAFAYFKRLNNYFRAHVEQFFTRFVHHVLRGGIVWHLVRPLQLPQFRRALSKFLQQQCGDEKARRVLGLQSNAEARVAEQQLSEQGTPRTPHTAARASFREISEGRIVSHFVVSGVRLGRLGHADAALEAVVPGFCLPAGRGR